MCGRYRCRSDKQRIAEAFDARAGLEELYLEPEDDIAPGSIQPVVRLNPDGNRQIELMRWGFKLPDRLLFNARSEGIEKANFWKEAFSKRRCIVPADSFFEWQQVKSGKKPKFEFTVPDCQPFGMAGVWSQWKNPKTEQWEHPAYTREFHAVAVICTNLVEEEITTLVPADIPDGCAVVVISVPQLRDTYTSVYEGVHASVAEEVPNAGLAQ